MSYGQPWRRMTGGPPAGPASAYPTLSRPALTCFNGPNELFVLPAGASAATALGNCAATMVMAAAARMRRRFWLTVSGIEVSPGGVKRSRTGSQGLDGRERFDDLIRGHDGAGVARDIDVERGVHLIVRVIRGRVSDHRDLVA